MESLSEYIESFELDKNVKAYLLHQLKRPQVLDSGIIYLNPSQIVAILNILKTVNFPPTYRTNTTILHNLYFSIVGPAGTGKTTTIRYFLYSMICHTGLIDSFMAVHNFCERNDNNLPKPDDTARDLRVLLLTPTQVAAQVLQEAFYKPATLMTYNEEETAVMASVPLLFQRIMPGHSASFYDNKYLNHRQRFENLCAEGHVGSFQISTIGSVASAFDGRYNCKYRTKNGIPQYDLIIFDEASQINDVDIATVLSANAQDKNYDPCIPMIFFGDPWQLPPHSVLRDWYHTNQTISILHKLLPSQSPRNNGVPICPYVMLNEQLRFHPCISKLANIITKRTVYNGKPDASFDKIAYKAHHAKFLKHDIVDDRRLSEIEWAYPVCFIDVYNGGARHMEISHMNSGSRRRDVQNFSHHEALSVAKLVYFLLANGHYQEHDLTIYTPYNGHCECIREALSVISSDIFDCTAVTVQTVMRSQGDENSCVILSPGRHFTRDTENASLGICGDEFLLHVAVTRAIDQLFFVGDLEFLSGKSELWDLVVGFGKLEGRY